MSREISLAATRNLLRWDILAWPWNVG